MGFELDYQKMTKKKAIKKEYLDHQDESESELTKEREMRWRGQTFVDRKCK